MLILDICTEVVFHDFSAPKMWNIFTPGVILLNGLNSIGHRCFFQALFSCLQKQRRQSAKGSDGKLPNTYICCAWKVRIDWGEHRRFLQQAKWKSAL